MFKFKAPINGIMTSIIFHCNVTVTYANLYKPVIEALDIEYGPKTQPNEKLDSFTFGIKWNLAVAQNLLGILLIFELIAKWILDFKVST